MLDDFARMRLYRNRASEFELLAEAEALPEARLRYRIIASHYRELAARAERGDKARVAQTLEQLKDTQWKAALLYRQCQWSCLRDMRFREGANGDESPSISA
jgi:hypothetical protein